MSHKGTTETFYREIINKVIEKMRADFNNELIPEDNLTALKNVKILSKLYYSFH